MCCTNQITHNLNAQLFYIKESFVCLYGESLCVYKWLVGFSEASGQSLWGQKDTPDKPWD